VVSHTLEDFKKRKIRASDSLVNAHSMLVLKLLTRRLIRMELYWFEACKKNRYTLIPCDAPL